MDIISKPVYQSTSVFQMVRFPLKQLFTIDNMYSIMYHEFSSTYDSRGDVHDFWEIVFMDKGEAIVRSDHLEFTLKSGEMIIHSPGTFHNIRANGQSAPDAVIITFDCDSRYMHFFKHAVIVLSTYERRLFSDIMREAISAFEIGERRNGCMVRKPGSMPGSQQMIRIRLEELMISLCRRRGEIYQKKRQVDKASSIMREQLFSDSIVDYLEKNTHRNVTLSELSDYFCTSISNLKKTFKAEKNRPIKDYFTDLKIISAKKAIRETGLNYTIIARSFGFASVHHFSTVFKKRTGMSPSEYDKSIKLRTNIVQKG